VTTLESLRDDVRRRVDEALDRWLPDAATGPLAAAMRHAVFAGGKRLRPTLVAIGCRDVDGVLEDALGAAAAVELVHTYSLVHDDLPCMDDAELRRGQPCVHVTWNEAMGVLAGDALLTLAFEVLATRTPAHRPAAAMGGALARAAGWDGTVGGQVLDLDGEGRAPDVEQVRRIHLGKTAALFAASLELGGLVGGGAPRDVARLSDVGRDLGLAFQIVDDVLDVERTPEELGKPTGADADAGKMTWPAAVGVERAREDARALVEAAVGRAGAGGAADLIAQLGTAILRR